MREYETKSEFGRLHQVIIQQGNLLTLRVAYMMITFVVMGVFLMN